MSTTMTRARIASVGPLLFLLLGGCQQSGNPSMPIAPIGPLGGNTRVPPPQTGSYAVPNGYYQGQAANTPSTSGNFAASAMGASTLTPNRAPSLRATSAAPGESQPMGGDPAVQTASHQTVPALQAEVALEGSAPVGSGVAPRIPASALQQSSAVDATLRPELRGMGVIDMTSSAALQPTDPPSLRTVDAGGRHGASDAWSSTAPPSFKSLSPVSDPNGGESRPERGVTEPSGAATDSLSVVGGSGAREVPTTSKNPADADRSAAKTESAALPWRKPRS